MWKILSTDRSINFKILKTLIEVYLLERKQRIVFCIASLGTGGAERVISVLANKLVEDGNDVSIIIYLNKCVYNLSEKIVVEHIDCEADAELPYIKRYPLRLKKIRNAVKRLSPDVVISFMAETNMDVCFALWGSDIPIIVSERNDPTVCPASKIKRMIRKFAYIKPKGFVFQTPDAQAYFSKRIQKKSKIILNPLVETLPEPFQCEREKRVVAVGRLSKEKNFFILIDAFAKFVEEHIEYTLEIYGEGVLENMLKEYISNKKLNGKVALKGFCKDVHSRILSAAMFVMSSDFEGMPNALLEAMALGLPCISTDCPCGGPRMLIETYENGILVPIKDSQKMLEAMEFMVNNPDKAKEMSFKAVQVRERADVDAITKKWLEIVNLCKEK